MKLIDPNYDSGGTDYHGRFAVNFEYVDLGPIRGVLGSDARKPEL